MKNLHRLSPKYTDGQLAERSRTWHYIFKDKLADFQAFDPDMKLAFADAWLQQIEELEDHQNDENTVDLLQQYTEDVATATGQMIDKVSNLEYFIDEVYRSEPYRKKETGIANVYKLRYGSATALLFACRVLVLQTNKILPQLSAAGMPPTLMPELEAAIANTDQRMLIQDTYKLTRVELTNQRIILFNRLYLTHRQVYKAAQNVYAHHPVFLKQFE